MKLRSVVALSLAVLVVSSANAAPLGSGFLYQGQLTDTGSPANGWYDFKFTLFDVAEYGFPAGPTITNTAVSVKNGVFNAELDFGISVFSGEARWLEIAVRTNGGENFSLLSPRQPVTATPYALYAPTSGTANTASNLVGTLPDSQLSTNVVQLTSSPVFTAGVTAPLFLGTFTGDGTAVTNVDADRLDGNRGTFYQNAGNLNSGTLSDGRLSTNVALRDASQIFTGVNIFSNHIGVLVTGAQVPLSLSGNGPSGKQLLLQSTTNVSSLAAIGMGTNADVYIQTYMEGAGGQGNVVLQGGLPSGDSAGGRVGIGTSVPAARLHVAGSVAIGNTTDAAPPAGSIRWTGTDFEGYTGTGWVSLTGRGIGGVMPIANMVWIPPGTFVMGSPDTEVDREPDEGPQTAVTLNHGFYMGKYAVTQADYLALTGTNPSYWTDDLNRPVDTVSWSNAVSYCQLLTQRERDAGRIAATYEYRLPTEAEWEYTCRAGTTTRFSYGDDPNYALLSSYAWYWDDSGAMTHPVGQKLPNPWGLFDMGGNVWEWCMDWYGPYPGGSLVDPKGPALASHHVIRGGAWSSSGAGVRSANRYYNPPTYKGNDLGFRVVLAPNQP